jgi:hypothetical protein
MGRSSYDAEKVLVFDNGRHCGIESRIVFRSSRLEIDHPDAAGFINYQRAIAVVHRDPDGALFIERTEPLILGWPPLTLQERKR